jgi:hypothetical protein
MRGKAQECRRTSVQQQSNREGYLGSRAGGAGPDDFVGGEVAEREGSVERVLFIDVGDNMYVTDGWALLEVIARRRGDHSALSARRTVVCLDALTEQIVELTERQLARYWELQAW